MKSACFLFTCVYSRNPAYLGSREDFKKLGLKKGIIAKLHRHYNALVKSGQIGVDVDFMLSQFNIPVSDLCRVVYCLDKHYNNTIDFRQFALSTWNLCTQPLEFMGIDTFSLSPNNFI